jgi:hypothetical protein
VRQVELGFKLRIADAHWALTMMVKALNRELGWTPRAGTLQPVGAGFPYDNRNPLRVFQNTRSRVHGSSC